eukprot:CAMPEP_0117554070 /NCGR_PEP_ID=MMETSP0784-20121206/50560_1 /TAXON_ID=39447 /ORGANISM="" /LENGTH=110 /DNA_ID=CAMNT_0005351215 /DNA_START=173 /DNA_END=505 /DNA_ORIENTATION=+
MEMSTTQDLNVMHINPWTQGIELLSVEDQLRLYVANPSASGPVQVETASSKIIGWDVNGNAVYRGLPGRRDCQEEKGRTPEDGFSSRFESVPSGHNTQQSVAKTEFSSQR